MLLFGALALIVAGCAANDENDGDGTANVTGPTFVDLRFDGVFTLDEFVIEGEAAPLTGTTAVTLDAQFGEIAVSSACGTRLGAFSLLPDGRAGVTIAGGSTRECGDAAAAQEVALTAALSRVDAWEESDSTLVLLSSAEDQLRLVR